MNTFSWKELDKVSSADVKPSDMKNQLVENLVNIGKEYAEDDDKYFPLSKCSNRKKESIEIENIFATFFFSN